MKKINLTMILLVLGIFILSFSTSVFAEDIFKQYNNVNIQQPVRLSGAPSSSISCNITVYDPDHLVIVNFTPMTNQYSYHNYTIPGGGIIKTGTYDYDLTCSGGGFNSTQSFLFDVTPTGKKQNSFFNNPVLIIVGIIGMLFFILGFYGGNNWFGFISAVLFLILGVYIMIYGFNDTTDLYTRGSGLTIIVWGFFVMFSAAYELAYTDNKGDED